MEKDGEYTFFFDATNDGWGIKFNCSACNAALEKEVIYCQQYISCTACDSIIQVPSTASEAERLNAQLEAERLNAELEAERLNARRRQDGSHPVDASGRAVVECTNAGCWLQQFRVDRTQYYGLFVTQCPNCRSEYSVLGTAKSPEECKIFQAKEQQAREELQRDFLRRKNEKNRRRAERWQDIRATFYILGVLCLSCTVLFGVVGGIFWLGTRPASYSGPSGGSATSNDFSLKYNCRQLLKETLHDPDSLEIIEERLVRPGREGGEVGYYIKYRAKNALNAKVLSEYYVE
jgi:uncharacterized Zn finger protein (UPF0148 family)